MLSNAVSSYYSNINNINYDTTFLTTYKLHSDDDDRNLCYQLQLLQALNISNYDSIILATHIDKIGFFLQNNYELEAILKLLQTKYKDTNIAFMIDGHNSNALFQLLFSYDYFDVTHKCLCKYISEKKQNNELTKNELTKNELTKNELTKNELTKTYFDELKNVILL
jgi:hypothetical protein